MGFEKADASLLSIFLMSNVRLTLIRFMSLTSKYTLIFRNVFKEVINILICCCIVLV